MAKDKPSRSRDVANKVIFAALQILKERGGQAPGRDVIAEVEKRVALSEWANAVYEKSGYVRWQSILHWMDVRNVTPKATAAKIVGKAMGALLKGSALHDEKSESASALIYWNGEVVWRPIG